MVAIIGFSLARRFDRSFDPQDTRGAPFVPAEERGSPRIGQRLGTAAPADPRLAAIAERNHGLDRPGTLDRASGPPPVLPARSAALPTDAANRSRRPVAGSELVSKVGGSGSIGEEWRRTDGGKHRWTDPADL
ncbi:hypothetical protein [Oharaeibacter diazotrophicus]|uniref:hypothetical protein n=1 Tax=Oharaeibacter diazotrophicus TaxID=1920512 RepID=UPI000F8244C6|nr:hypothetical protein [Oharaeibacter diazotrophicus]GLS77574.1 hypothetical protein GCM10007904_29110 [Oharaeibacter diazotrophicus]